MSNPGPGHNSRAQVAEGDSAEKDGGGGNIAADELRLLIERAERLEEEKKAIADDLKDVFAEAKARGFDAPAIRKIIKIRKMKFEDWQHQQGVLETYMSALGMI